jgi:hypothetical protein
MIALAFAAGFIAGFWLAVCLPEVKRAWRMARGKREHERAIKRIRADAFGSDDDGYRETWR